MAFLHDSIGLEAENLLRHLGFLVKRPGIPVKLREIKDKARDKGSPVERMNMTFGTTYEGGSLPLPPSIRLCNPVLTGHNRLHIEGTH